ncbi:MAG: hypothetical protein HFG39_08685 [Lachnospiraceae bacterium]|nr:hypothetical protein [Lachnospiraceae bacterium]
MPITLFKLSNTYHTLSELAKEKLPIKLSYAINKNIHFLEPDYHFYQNKMYELYQTYFKTDENGQFLVTEIDENTSSYQVKEGKTEELTKKIQELNNTEISIETYPFDLDLLINSNIQIEANLFNDIDYLIANN